LSSQYILDACALIALLMNETGADEVSAMFNQAYRREMKISMNKLNLLEVYYDTYRSHGKETADIMFVAVKELPIMVISDMTDNVFAEAGRLKATYRISLADAVALASTSVSGGMLVTADHHEFDVIEQKEKIQFYWIR
jgi:predicted nucleic acid-binding protein